MLRTWCFLPLGVSNDFELLLLSLFCIVSLIQFCKTIVLVEVAGHMERVAVMTVQMVIKHHALSEGIWFVVMSAVFVVPCDPVKFATKI